MNTLYDFVEIICCNCRMQFAVRTEVYQELQRTHEWFHCPKGHRQLFTKEAEEDKLRRELEMVKRGRALARDERDRTERSLRATRGHLTRYKNRTESGHCPICDAHVKELAAHMEQEHKESEDAAA